MAQAFLPVDFQLYRWEDLAPFFEDLENRVIQSKEDLFQWITDRSTLETFLEEDMGWRYIRMTCDTRNKERENAYLFFVQEIEPKLSAIHHKLNEKMVGSPYLSALESPENFTYFRKVQKELEIFREENIPLMVEIQTLTQKYSQISGEMTIEWEGKTFTLQQAANELKNPNRDIRKRVWLEIQNRRLQDAEKLNNLFDQLLTLRHQVATQAGFDNFRDYMFAALGRFDYSVSDCFDFHEAVKETVIPLLRQLDEQRKADLNQHELRPWDFDVDPQGKTPLKPFLDGEDLLNKTVACFEKIDPFFKDTIVTMRQIGHFDVESRIGKAPGGYNYPLPKTGFPFIFMNAAGNTRDVETMVHEAGHAFHSVLTRNLTWNAQKNFPSEVAELASMSMELISADAQMVFFNDPDELKRAKKEHLEGILRVLPWIATVDKFQHWIYTNPYHTAKERGEAWLQINAEFSTGLSDWTGIEKYRPFGWHKQLHIFEVPFYYIEYGFAQLGALGVWANYLQDPKKALEEYKNALTLGYTATLPEIYKTAGVRFDFSKNYIQSLTNLIQENMTPNHG